MERVCKILVVEDDDGVRALLGDVLDLAGYSFALASGGAEMRQAVDDNDFDVAIIDISLRGGEDGLILAAEARATGCGIILTSGDPRQRARLEGSGERHLVKPFRMQELIELIERVLRENRAACTPGRPRDTAVLA